MFACFQFCHRFPRVCPAIGLVLLAVLWAENVEAQKIEGKFVGKQFIHGAEEPLPPSEAAGTMRVPEGFRVSLFAGEPDVMQPIGFCLDDRGRLWVAEAYNYPNHGTEPGDRIVILEDSDGDGRHDKRTVFYEGLNYVTGIEVGFGGVWVMSPPNMYFIADRNHDDRPDEEPKVILDGFGNHANAHNLANGFAWGPDGWLYGTHGRTNWSMIGKPDASDSERRRFDGGVYRYHPIRDVWEPFADGTTNPWGIDWNDWGDAFVCNCVNPHLFQVIQGAHYEPWRGRKSSEFAYQRIDTIADHLHFVGLGSVRNGLGSDAEDNAGGGHAHCGTMIYLGDLFPEKYRNQLFTNNIHGRRINNDLLRQSGSGYVASHGTDLMRSADPWFMGVTLACGPSGEVYVSDWSDTGECHSTRNTRRHTGRIYRLTYLKTDLPTIDLSKQSNQQLAELQLHENDWQVRHARRLLHERATAGQEMSDVRVALNAILKNEAHVPKRLRALWTLWVIDALPDDQLVELLGDEDASVRGWAVRLLCEDGDPPKDGFIRMMALASQGESPRVRLSLASALQRLPSSKRWSLAEALASRGEDSADQNLPLMIWYGLEPLIQNDLDRFARLAGESSIPRVRENIARRIASSQHSRVGLNLLCQTIAADRDPASQVDIVRGIELGLEGQRNLAMPDDWPAAYKVLLRSRDTETRQRAMQLALVFQDQQATEGLKQIAADVKAESENRRQAIHALVTNRVSGLGVQLLSLLDDQEVRGQALRGLSQYGVDEVPSAILARYAGYPMQEKQLALQTLASRVGWASELLNAVEQGLIPASEITALTARQLRSFGDKEINSRLAKAWGNVRETPSDRKKQIDRLGRLLSEDVLSRADLANGKALFTKHCANCHRFFGEGGAVGPDITGAQRTNLGYLLENIVDPSASVAKEFHMQMFRTTDGRVINGLVESEGEHSVTIINANEKLVVPLDEIEARKSSEVSIMPNGLLDPLGEREIRDLFGYLQQ